MERALEKHLEKIRRIRGKESYEKAWAAFKDLRANYEESYKNELAFYREGTTIALQRNDWTETLSYFKDALENFKLDDLCNSENRLPFIAYVEEHPGFLTGLANFLLSRQSLNNIAGWVRLYADANQRWIIDHWMKAAADLQDERHAGTYYVAAGVGRFVRGEMEEALSIWFRALKAQPRFLKRIMTFCQRSGLLDMTRFHHRLQIIRLIIAAGKRTEALSLLSAMGHESRDYALKILVEVNSLFPEADGADITLVKFKLAVFLNDSEIFDRVMGQVCALPEDELFDFKKVAMLQINDPESKRRVLIDLVKTYIDNQSWESAALLLKNLYSDDPHPDVIAQMEAVLERYPILPELHFIVGKAKMEDNNHDRALYHLTAVREVSEYRRPLTRLLEDQLSRKYHAGYATLLYRIAPTDSHGASMIALWRVLEDGEPADALLAELDQRRPKDPPSPFYLLAMIFLLLREKKYPAALPEVKNFLLQYPELSCELIQPAEDLCNHYVTDYRDLVRAIERVKPELKPARAWAALTNHFQEVTERHFKQQSEEEEKRKKPPAPQASNAREEVRNTIQRHFQTNNWAAALNALETWTKRHPEDLAPLFTLGDQFAQSPTLKTYWLKAKLNLLLGKGMYSEAVKLGRQCINEPAFQSDLPEIYQLLGTAYEGFGHLAEALRFYCLSSRQNRFWQTNRRRLGELVFPDNAHLLKEVLNLALLHEDQTTWEPLLQEWHQHNPHELELIIRAQTTFMEKVGTARAILDLAFWHLQTGDIDSVNQTLARIDLRDPEIREALIHITSLINLKFPQDPKPAFLLGRYYLVHSEVPRAVDTFRNLTAKVPNAAETVYQYLRGYLRKNPDSIDVVHLYGLLIRIALDFDFSVAAVKLLEEFSHKDKPKAESLAEGVYRVLMLKKKENREALYEFAKLLFQWGAYGRMLLACEQAEFGRHMAQDRLQWMQTAAKNLEIRDEAKAGQARIYYEMHEFEKAFELLESLENDRAKMQVLDLYVLLAKRFPDRLDFWHDAGWISVREDLEQAAFFFRKIWETRDATPLFRLEAFALLRESGANPDFSELEALFADDKALMYDRLAEAYGKVRELELRHWLESTSNSDPNTEAVPVPGKALDWLLHTGQHLRFAALMKHLEHAPDNLRILLESKYLFSLGDRLKAALHITESQLPVSLRQSFLHAAGLTPRAIALKPPGTRLPNFLRQDFIESYGKPETIRALFSRLKVVNSANRPPVMNFGDEDDPANETLNFSTDWNG
ncbi:tetratricopeptide repeat protein [Acanthopleuribacter pedis]|uniref:Tetratricopeptide repeat protein n=1 Tax=Acanthopleuribacter pedis TaxID=442870 RepID=A0A8J7Q5K0_9BACT|nr:hypothetical protein [Acanthopleuribacter pedis]MBO1317029.1 hypothetical protein [Acanthopleuribacter pedis]